jgi:hypothetical protein
MGRSSWVETSSLAILKRRLTPHSWIFRQQKSPEHFRALMLGSSHSGTLLVLLFSLADHASAF